MEGSSWCLVQVIQFIRLWFQRCFFWWPLALNAGLSIEFFNLFNDFSPVIDSVLFFFWHCNKMVCPFLVLFSNYRIFKFFVLFVHCCLEKFNIVLPGFLSHLCFYSFIQIYKNLPRFSRLNLFIFHSLSVALSLFPQIQPWLYLASSFQPLLATVWKTFAISSFMALILGLVWACHFLAFAS